MKYTNEPDDSCPYIDSVLTDTEKTLNKMYDDFSDIMYDNKRNLETVRNINETLRIDNRELSSRVEELEMQVIDQEQKIANLHSQLKDYESEIYRLEIEIQEVGA